jgi:hypothetical protein
MSSPGFERDVVAWHIVILVEREAFTVAAALRQASPGASGDLGERLMG